MRRILISSLFFLLLSSISFAQSVRVTDADVLAAQVKQEFLHAWNGYKAAAWGEDGLQPLSNTPYSWFGGSLLVTPVDAFSTMKLMGLEQEAKEAQELILTRLSFDQDVEVKHFEIVIRILGGLLSAYQSTGEPRFLQLADDLGTRMLPVFDSPTGLPYVFINLRTGAVRGDTTNPAEAGTLLMEYGTLSKLTGKPVYYEKAKRALTELFNRRSTIGLVGQTINVRTGKWVGTTSHLGGLIDSYYEYLFKCWKLFGDEECGMMWRKSIHALNRYLPDTVNGRLWYARVEIQSGERVMRRWGGLEAFFSGLLAYSGDIPRARSLQTSNMFMWNRHNIEPEVYHYGADTVRYDGYPLRPEIMESAWYLYTLTGDILYQAEGRKMFQDLRRYCRTKYGYAELGSVITKEQRDMMESFFLAETMKYLYLLFAPPGTVDLNTTVFNTEAHPLKRTWN